MSLKHTLLGLLILHPQTGYDLNKRMERATFLLESASLRRIYPTLKKMTKEELVTFHVEPQDGKPDRKIYTVTDAGEAEFLTWLREPPEQDDFRMEHLFAKFFFYGILDKDSLLKQLRKVLAARQKKLERMQTIELAPPLGPCRPIVDSERVTAIWNLGFDYARTDLQTQIQWLKDTIQHMEQKW